MAPSARHVELQNMAARWIGNRSFKMCALPECASVGYVADFVAIAGMYDSHHTRYTTHSGLRKKFTRGGLDPLIVGDVDRWYVCVFEVKVSRSDFLNTFGNKGTSHAKGRMSPVGTAHWVVADRGVCTADELPDFWGLLQPHGPGLSEKKVPKLNVLQDSQIHAIGFDMMWLQMNYRRSYFDQLWNMAEAIREVHQGIVRQVPRAELLRRAGIAKEKCNGLI